jgi:hypothetical protein
MIKQVFQKDSTQPPTQASTQADAPQNTDTEVKSDSDFSKELSGMLSSYDGTNVSEEALFSALVGKQLKDTKGEETFNQYSSMVSAITGPGSSFEEQSVKALLQLTESGALSEEEASKIYSNAFGAAQLDNDAEHLFDHIGGDTDKTKATAAIASGISKAEETMKLIESGVLAAPSLSIREATARAMAAFSMTGGKSGSVGSTVSSGDHSGGSGPFLYKPVSDSDGKLVVLSSSTFSDQVESARITKDGQILEEGRWGGIGNGNRAHFRFSKSGSSYPDNLAVEFILKDGTVKSYEITESSDRTEQQ